MKRYTAMIGGEVGINGSPVKPTYLAKRLNKFEVLQDAIKRLIAAETLEEIRYARERVKDALTMEER